MKLFLDDVRTPDAGWELVRTAEECIEALSTGMVEELSLDHDLGYDKTGYDVLSWIEEKVITSNFKPPRIITIHSQNPAGVDRMKLALQSIIKTSGIKGRVAPRKA